MEKDFNIQEGITKAHPEFKQKVIKSKDELNNLKNGK